MISYQYKFTNKQNVSLTFNDHTTDPSKIYALQSYPTISKAIKNTEVERDGQNNFWDFFSYYGKLTFNFTGIMVANSLADLEEMKLEMLKVFGLPLQPTDTNDGYVTMEWTDDAGINKTVQVKLVNDIQFDRGLKVHYKMSFILQLKAKTNYIYDSASLTTVSGVRAWYQAGGILLSTLLPFTWNPNWQNAVSVPVTGAGAFPIIKIFGEDQQVLQNPTITNTTTGEVFKINMNLTGSTSWIEIDTELGTIKDQAGSDISSFVDPDSAFINLVTGVNTLLYTSDEDPYVSGLLPNGVIEVKYKNYYAI